MISGQSRETDKFREPSQLEKNTPQVTIKNIRFTTIPYTTCAFYGVSPEIHVLMKVTSHLVSKVGQSVASNYQSTHVTCY